MKFKGCFWGSLIAVMCGCLATTAEGYFVAVSAGKGVGAVDATARLQALLDAPGREVVFPPGVHTVSKTLLIDAGKHLCATGATVRLATGANCVLLANRERANGLVPDITVVGGVWDGNNVGQDRTKYTGGGWAWGQLIAFAGVTNLTLRGLTVKDANSFGIQLTDVVDFTVEDLTFSCNNLTPNQDGLHINGFARQGRIRRLGGHTNDDLVALNSDEGVFRSADCTIEDIVIDGLDGGEDGYTAVRLLSRDALVRNVVIRNVGGRYKFNVVSFTHWSDAVKPGMGHFEDILIENITATSCRKSGTGHGGLIWFQPGVQSVGDVTIRNLRRVEGADYLNTTHTIDIGANVKIHRLTLDDVTQSVPDGKPLLAIDPTAVIDERVGF